VGLLVAGVVVYLQDDRTGRPTATGAALPSSREVGWDGLEVGDCVNDETLRGGSPVETVDVVPCRQPHDLEVYANVTVPGNAFPGDQALEKFADRSCVAYFKDYVGIPFRDSEFSYQSYVPSEGSWNEGDRLVTCGVVDPDLEKLTGSARGARR
jgi:Septum formation